MATTQKKMKSYPHIRVQLLYLLLPFIFYLFFYPLIDIFEFGFKRWWQVELCLLLLSSTIVSCTVIFKQMRRSRKTILILTAVGTLSLLFFPIILLLLELPTPFINPNSIEFDKLKYIAILAIFSVINYGLLSLLILPSEEQNYNDNKIGGSALILPTVIFLLLIFILPPINYNYTKPTHVVEGLQLAASAKLAINEFYKKNNRFPNNNEEAAINDFIKRNAVDSIDIEENGIIIIHYSEKVRKGTKLTLIPSINQSESIKWQCTSSIIDPKNRIPTHELPPPCKE